MNLPGLAAGKTVPLATFLTRLIWLCIMPLLLLAVWLAVDSVLSVQARSEREAHNLAQNVATSIDQMLQARINALHMLAVSPLVDAAKRWPELYREAQGFREGFGSHVIFADTNRQMLFNTRVPYGTELPKLPDSRGRTAAPMALETGQPVVGDIVFGPVAKVPLVAIVVPVLRDGKATHLMLTLFETAMFQQRLEQVTLPEGWSLALLDGTGTDIARRAPPGFDAQGDVDAAGRSVVKSKLSPWSVTLEIPRTNYRMPLVVTGAVLVAAIFLATLFGVLGGRFAGRRLGRQVAELAAPSGAVTTPLDIAEIAAARRTLDAAAESVRASEERYRRLFHEAPLPLAYVNREGVLIDRNTRFVQTFGYTEADVPTLAAWWPRAYPDPAYRAWVLDTWSVAVAKAAQGAGIAALLAGFPAGTVSGAVCFEITGGSDGTFCIFSGIGCCSLARAGVCRADCSCERPKAAGKRSVRVGLRTACSCGRPKAAGGISACAGIIMVSSSLFCGMSAGAVPGDGSEPGAGAVSAAAF